MVKLFGMDFHEGTMEQVVDSVIRHAKYGDKFKVVVTPNSDHVVKLDKLHKIDADFVKAYKAAAWHLADGMPIVLASRLLGNPLAARLTGADFLPVLLEAAQANGLSINILGANGELLDEFYSYCKSNYPKLTIRDYVAAPFPFHPLGEEAKSIASAFNEYRADIVLACVGFPKQEKFLFEYGEMTGSKVGVAIGAAIEFLVGKKKRAPLWMQKYGLEFTHRWASEPRRLTPRYLSDFAIIPLTLKEKIKALKNKY
jgi:N-acetylglucosaminyldiphosphoundecaprenol N-acetyl-beta-D-mannosaminyltransferase